VHNREDLSHSPSFLTTGLRAFEMFGIGKNARVKEDHYSGTIQTLYLFRMHLDQTYGAQSTCI